MSDMNALDIARRLAELGQTTEACKAYTLALAAADGSRPEEELEGALYILQMGGSYKVAYDALLSLHRRGCYADDCLAILTEAFYTPNEKQLRGRYEKNCKLLSKYPYLFRKDFPDFEALPIRFYPYDDTSYVPYDTEHKRFGEKIDFNAEIISRNFFHDLEQPVLAAEVWSQHELEYLNDNVRKSEWVARENHIYLHYPDWGVFCSHLQHWEWKSLLRDEKIVFLIGEEIGQYPIDFKERFGIDYSRYTVRPVGIREVNRIIWHTQLSSHNGGDFFNEIFDGHPNLLFFTSIMHHTMQEGVEELREVLDKARSMREIQEVLDHWGDPRLVEELYTLKNRTDKDVLVAIYLAEKDWSPNRDPAARIAPALFYQPHFGNIYYRFRVHEKNQTVLYAKEAEEIYQTSFFKQFKYVKTFTPLRRFTTSHAATVRFMMRQRGTREERLKKVPDVIAQRVLNRSFMLDRGNRLFRDSVLVRFEDAKLNPTATFKALAAFVDLPYTESMTYCSFGGVQNPAAVGMSPEKVYVTYDEFANDTERYFLEYFLRDAYEYYGYDFQYYDGAPVDLERAKELIEGFTAMDQFIKETVEEAFLEYTTPEEHELETLQAVAKKTAEQEVLSYKYNRIKLAETMLRGLRFVNQQGRALRMMPMLKLDPALLERPLYR